MNASPSCLVGPGDVCLVVSQSSVGWHLLPLLTSRHGWLSYRLTVPEKVGFRRHSRIFVTYGGSHLEVKSSSQLEGLGRMLFLEPEAVS